MRQVKKYGIGTTELQNAHLSPPTSGTNATDQWDKLKRKDALLENCLLAEQYRLCCYSEVRADLLGIGYHIEHVENKSQAPSRTFDYGNLAASAFNSELGLQTAKKNGWAVFGGHASGKQGKPGLVDMTLFISPHQPGFADFFVYTSDGGIGPRSNLSKQNTLRVEYTIKTLKLDSPYLVSLRRQWWDDLDKDLQEHQINGWDVECLMSLDFMPYKGGLSNFFSLSRQFYQVAADAWLQAHEPTLF